MTIIKSGGFTLKKLTKTQVKNVIRDKGFFDGYLCGNKVSPYHIVDGWKLGYRKTFDNIKQFNKFIDDFETQLYYYSDFGSYLHYYQIVK